MSSEALALLCDRLSTCQSLRFARRHHIGDRLRPHLVSRGRAGLLRPSTLIRAERTEPPQDSDSSSPAHSDRNQLQTQLNVAIAAENFPEAARIRDQLQRLGGASKRAVLDWRELGIPEWLAERTEQLGFRYPTGRLLACVPHLDQHICSTRERPTALTASCVAARAAPPSAAVFFSCLVRSVRCQRAPGQLQSSTFC